MSGRDSFATPGNGGNPGGWRLTDEPHPRLVREKAGIIPPEEHRETLGYHLPRDGKPITTDPSRPGDRLEVAEPGQYQAVAVEWSGLRSEPSPVQP